MALRSAKDQKRNEIMSQQIANSLKMSAYLNKNTFSSATALPPEENRLNFLDIISKGSNPIWKRNEPEENKETKSKFSVRRPNQTEEDIYTQIQLANCSKCG